MQDNYLTLYIEINGSDFIFFVTDWGLAYIFLFSMRFRSRSDTVFNFIDYKKWTSVSKKIKNVIDNNQEIKTKINNIYYKDKEIFLMTNNKNSYLPFEYLF